MRPLVLLFVATGICCAQPDYYVNSVSGADTADGSRAHPWKTLSRANTLLSPDGADIHVDPGNYPGPIVLRNATKGRLTFTSDVHWGAHIASVNSDRAVSLSGDFITFQGFEVTGDSSARLGIIINGSYAVVSDNHVHAIHPSVCTVAGGAGIDSASLAGHDNDIVGNWVHDIGFGLPCDLLQGIYYANSGGHCTNNVVFRVPGAGIAAWHGANSVLIDHNLVFDAAEDGILIGNGDAGAGLADHFVVSNNVVIHNGHFGITEFGKLIGKSNVYSGNTLHGNAAGNYHLTSGAVAAATITADLPR